jgi:hypothetical protein
MNRGLPPHHYQQHVRRVRARRETPSLESIQLVAAIVMVLCACALAALAVAPAFSARRMTIAGARFTSESIVRSIVGIDSSPNLITLRAAEAAGQLVQLPAVKSATVEVRLPDTVVVTLVEREPKLVWVIDGSRYAVDENGFLFGVVDPAGNPIPSSHGPMSSGSPSAGATGSGGASSRAEATASVTPSAAASAGASAKASASVKVSAKATATTKSSPTLTPRPTISLSPLEASLQPSLVPPPTADPAVSAGPGAIGLRSVIDRTAMDADLGLGGVVDAVTLDAGYRLANLTTTDVGSKATDLAVIVDDLHGFTLSSVPSGWVAEFGFYASSVRSVTVIPAQVRDLRSLLLDVGESKVAWVWLVADVSSNHANTYLPR